VNLRQLECFFAVADTLHFGRAAERLHLAQSGVSTAIRSLESELGQPLFDRAHRRVRLTSFGAAFLLDVRPAYDALEGSVAKHRRQVTAAQRLRIGHTPELGQWLFPHLLNVVDAVPVEQRPAWVPVMLHTSDQLAAVRDGTLEAGLVWRTPVPAGVRLQLLARLPFVAVLSVHDALAGRSEVTLEQLAGRHLVGSPRRDNPFVDEQLRAGLRSADLHSAALDEVASFDELAVHVAARGVVGLHPAPIAVISRLPGVVFRRIAEPSLTTGICLVGAERPQPAVRAFLAQLQPAVDAAVAQLDAALSGQGAKVLGGSAEGSGTIG
jgi:DNA-binding transcriptional LysR family regulator